MKNGNLINLCSLLLCIFIAIISFNIGTINTTNKEYIIIIFMFVINVILTISHGLISDRNYLKGTAIRSVITFFMVYILVTYLLGILLGFTRSYLVLDIFVEIKNILPVILIVVFIEYFRKIVFSISINNKKIIYIVTSLIIGLSIIYELNLSALITSEDKFIFLCSAIFPIIATELLCSFMTYKISWIPSLIYKLFLNLYIYLVPILPNLGDYIYSVINIILPFLVYYDVNNMLIKYEKDKKIINKKYISIVSIFILILSISLVILISGIFRYKVIAIASDSMVPVFSRGDAVLYEKISPDELVEGDVIAFKKDNIIVTHRIIDIWKKGDLSYYITKGDNNNSVDTFIPTENDFLGKVQLRFKYVGYPTVLINEFFRKE